MKELRELIRDLREEHNLIDKVRSDCQLDADISYYGDNACLGNITVHDVMCDIQKLKPQGDRELARYLQYLERIEEYEASRRQSRG